MQLRDRIYKLIIEDNYCGASELLQELESMDAFIKHNVNQQFIKTIKALLYEAACDAPKPNFPDILLDALKITCPHFDENNIESYYLTYNEIILLNKYAAYFLNTGDATKASDVYERILRHLDSKCVDDIQKAHMYSTVILNYSSSLGRVGRLNEALAALSAGECFERNHGRLIELPAYAFNKGYGMMMLGMNEESIPYFALAYYGSDLFAKYGLAPDLPVISETAKANLGINFH